jgi:hypothetical protein
MRERKDAGLSVCGCNCLACDYLKKSKCNGCDQVEGKVWWANFVSKSVCLIYECVVDLKKIDNCGICSDLPCQIWRDLKDPSYTDEQHENSINERVVILKSLNR